MGKIKVNVKGAQPSPQKPQQSVPHGVGFNEPSEAAYGYPANHGRYYDYEPQENIRQHRSNIPQTSRQKPSAGYSGYPYSHGQPADYYQQREHPFAPQRGGYSSDPFQQFFGPQYQQRRQPQPQARQPYPMNPPSQLPTRSPAKPVPVKTEKPNESVPNDAIPSDRNEGGLLQDSGKQYSIASTQTFTKLDTIKAKYNDLLSRVNEIESTTNKEESESLNKSKNLLAQISGDIDRLQFTGLDAIDTSMLHTGKDEARTKRKKLNHDIEELQQHVQELHKIYGEMGSKMTEHEKVNETKAEASSSTLSEEDSSSETYGNVSEGPLPLSNEETNVVESTDAPEEVSTPTEEGNTIPSVETIEIDSKRIDEQKDSEESNETMSQTHETKKEINSIESSESEIEIEEVPVESPPQTQGPEDNNIPEIQEIQPSVAEENPMDTVDMTEWVIEDSHTSASQPTDSVDECAKLRLLLQEKDALIDRLRAQLLEKDQMIQTLQNNSSPPSSSS